MGNVVKFPRGDASFERMEWLLEQISYMGFEALITRGEHNRQGELAFWLAGLTEFDAKALPLMAEAVNMFEAKPHLRRQMYEVFYGVGALYYEASTSSALSFEEQGVAQ